MTIGSKIKKLRREHDMTQEQLAEYMNLSVSAVSQWECGKTMPDISQLPLLANIFEVSADELLGINIAKKEEKIKAILDEAQKYYYDGDFITAAEILLNGLHEFPNSYKTMERLADTLICKFDGSTLEAISLCEKVLEGCTENDVRNCAVQTLCTAYKYTGRTEDAIRTAESQAAAWFSREDMLLELDLYKGDKAIRLYHEYAMFCLNRLNECISNLTCVKKDDGNPAFNSCEAICLLEKIPALYRTFFEEGDYCYQSQYIERAYNKLSQIYAKNIDVENTLRYIESMAQYAITFDTYDQNSVYTSLAARGEETGGWIKGSCGNRTHQMIQNMDDKVYDFVRNDPRFAAVIENLKSYAKE